MYRHLQYAHKREKQYSPTLTLYSVIFPSSLNAFVGEIFSHVIDKYKQYFLASHLTFAFWLYIT